VDREWWNAHWTGASLPCEVRKSRDHSHNEILAVLDQHLPRAGGLSALEIGGAPGQYLAYLHRQFGYESHILDYSSVGCDKAKRNFELLGIPLTIHHADLFADDLAIGRFDVVYSLGFVEHFDDLTAVIERHVRLTKPGGTLLVGCPNFRGVNGWFLRRLAPAILAKHNLDIMDLDTWTHFERRFRLAPLFRGYVGGFEPSVFNRRERDDVRSRALQLSARTLGIAFRQRAWKRLNSPLFSHYVMGVYRVPMS
jgi:SAM-dependent methyltransferase